MELIINKSMKILISGILSIFITTVCFSQIITVHCYDTISVESVQESLRLIQTLNQFTNGVPNEYQFSQDYKELSSQELNNILNENSFIFNESENRIDTFYYRKSTIIKNVKNQIKLQINNVSPNQIEILKKLNSNSNNIQLIDKPMFVDVKVSDKIDEQLTTKTIEKARFKASKTASHLNCKLTDIYEIVILSEYPERIATTLDRYKANDKYLVELKLRVSFNTQEK